MEILNARIKHKRDTEENWNSADPVLLNGEVIIVDIKNGDKRTKTGDGKKRYSELPFDKSGIPNGGSAGQALVKTEDGEAWSNVKTVAEKSSQNSVSFQITGIDGEEFTIEFTKDEEGSSEVVTSFNGRFGEVIPQQGDYTADMVGAVPNTITINDKPLNENITLTAAEIGAATVTHGHSATEITSGVLDRSRVPGLPTNWITSGAFGVNRGGTGLSTLTKGYFLRGNGTNAVTLTSLKSLKSELGIGNVQAPKKICRYIIGTSKSGWSADDCDYLCDGIDDQAEINAAIQALPENGGEIIILDGVYSLSSNIRLNKNNVCLHGCGYGNTTFVNAGISGQSNEATMLEITSSYNNISNLKFKNSQTNKCAGIILKGESSKYAIANQIFSCIIEDFCYSTPPKPAYGILSGMYSSGVIGFGNIIRKCDEPFFSYSEVSFGMVDVFIGNQIIDCKMPLPRSQNKNILELNAEFKTT